MRGRHIDWTFSYWQKQSAVVVSNANEKKVSEGYQIVLLSSSDRLERGLDLFDDEPTKIKEFVDPGKGWDGKATFGRVSVGGVVSADREFQQGFRDSARDIERSLERLRMQTLSFDRSSFGSLDVTYGYYTLYGAEILSLDLDYEMKTPYGQLKTRLHEEAGNPESILRKALGRLDEDLERRITLLKPETLQQQIENAFLRLLDKVLDNRKR